MLDKPVEAHAIANALAACQLLQFGAQWTLARNVDRDGFVSKGTHRFDQRVDPLAFDQTADRQDAHAIARLAHRTRTANDIDTIVDDVNGLCGYRGQRELA